MISILSCSYLISIKDFIISILSCFFFFLFFYFIFFYHVLICIHCLSFNSSSVFNTSIFNVSIFLVLHEKKYVCICFTDIKCYF